jgi:ankyrin repeat protein
MSKPTLVESDSILENCLIETLLAGLKEWRPDLDYPESHSDMQACARALMRMYDIRRLPLPQPLKIKCKECDGVGKHIRHNTEDNSREEKRCEKCKGKGYTETF